MVCRILMSLYQIVYTIYHGHSGSKAQDEGDSRNHALSRVYVVFCSPNPGLTKSDVP